MRIAISGLRCAEALAELSTEVMQQGWHDKDDNNDVAKPGCKEILFTSGGVWLPASGASDQFVESTVY